MKAIASSEMSRRKALSLTGLASAFAVSAVPTVLAISDAEAQKMGLQRREGRHDRRDDRTGRTERRQGRHNGAPAALK